MTTINAVIKQLGPPIEFQLNSPRLPDFDAAIEHGVLLGGGAIEIWPETFTKMPRQRLKHWSAQIDRNHSP